MRMFHGVIITLSTVLCGRHSSPAANCKHAWPHLAFDSLHCACCGLRRHLPTVSRNSKMHANVWPVHPSACIPKHQKAGGMGQSLLQWV